MFALFMARRYLTAKRKQAVISVISVISIVMTQPSRTRLSTRQRLGLERVELGLGDRAGVEQ